MSNSRAWEGYDNWLLQGSGVDDDRPEVFETIKYKLFSINEDDVANFDDKIKIVEDLGVNHTDYCKDTYDNYSEFLEEQIESLQDDFNLYSDEEGAIEQFERDMWDKYVDACENGYKGKFRGRRFK